jgi:hypothetical protein
LFDSVWKAYSVLGHDARTWDYRPVQRWSELDGNWARNDWFPDEGAARTAIVLEHLGSFIRDVSTLVALITEMTRRHLGQIPAGFQAELLANRHAIGQPAMALSRSYSWQECGPRQNWLKVISGIVNVNPYVQVDWNSHAPIGSKLNVGWDKALLRSIASAGRGLCAGPRLIHLPVENLQPVALELDASVRSITGAGLIGPNGVSSYDLLFGLATAAAPGALGFEACEFVLSRLGGVAESITRVCPVRSGSAQPSLTR